MQQAKVIIGNGNFDYLLDKGYHDGEAITTCENHGLRTLISQPAASRSGEIPTPEYYNDKFIYEKTTDSYTCPAGQTLKSNGSLYKIKSWNGYSQVKQYKTGACSKCAYHNKCTSSPKGRGRIIQRSIYQEAVDANNIRVMQEKEKYRRRQEMVEHPFGIVKRQWGYDHILLKGIDKVEAESNLIFLCYDLRRVINVLGINALIKRLQEISLYFSKTGLKWLKMRILFFLHQENRTKKWVDWLSSNCLKRLNLNVKFNLKPNYCAD